MTRVRTDIAASFSLLNRQRVKAIKAAEGILRRRAQ
jgi:hypothetical protein